MQNRIYFVTGVCGVGKTSVIPFLRTALESEKYDVHDFDERGVPNNADRKWRLEETRHWIETGRKNFDLGKSTVICGFSTPYEIKEMNVADGIDIVFYLLDANTETIRTRLERRNSNPAILADLQRATGKSLKQFINENTTFATTLREACSESNCHIIDTSTKDISEVAKEISEGIKQGV